MSLRIVVPTSMLVDAVLATGTGSVAVEGPRLSGLAAGAGTGGVSIAPTSAGGSLKASTGTGSIDARFPSLDGARIQLGTGTGNVRLAVPADAQHGYDVRAVTGTGLVSVDLPGAQDEEPPRRTAKHVRTAGYEARAIQVEAVASAGTGSLAVGAGEAPWSSPHRPHRQ